MADFPRFFNYLVGRKFAFQFIYSDSYWMTDIGNHVFPVVKYRKIYEKLLQTGIKKENIIVSEPASEADVLRVHSPKYYRKLRSGKLSHSEITALEIPFSQEMLDFSMLSAGGTILTAAGALRDGLAVHIGGGFHHAFADHGEGFCILNDVAIAVAELMDSGKIQKAMIVDCDVHQGNGTAEIFQGNDDVFTFSIHQMDIYPAQKKTSSLDVGLWTGDGDVKYLGEIRTRFPRLYQEFRPDIVFYLAGADPYEKDQLGRLDITQNGLKERDGIIIEEARRLGIPVAVVLAGGYAYDVEDTVSIHFNTIKVAQKALRRYPAARRANPPRV